MSEREMTCLACGGKNMRPGQVNFAMFRPTARFMWRGYKMDAYVCADCGYVAQYVAPPGLREIRGLSPEQPSPGRG